MPVERFIANLLARKGNRDDIMTQTRFFAAVALTLLLAGCANIGGVYSRPNTQMTTETGEVKTVSAVRQIEKAELAAFPDIPIPATHKVDLQQSVIFSSPSQAMGKIVLVGRASLPELFRFFNEQMPSHGWSTVNAFESAVSSLYFAKPGRFVAVVITADSKVHINIGPE